ncbi:hypothetical protein BHE74_00009065 [Ensete ventricosum]|nr:hypothetical protein BHE74_00009065 [Ensete ventricosum]
MRLGTFLECIGSMPGWRKGVCRKKTETCRKIVGGLDDVVGYRREFIKSSPKGSESSLGTHWEIAGRRP